LDLWRLPETRVMVNGFPAPGELIQTVDDTTDRWLFKEPRGEYAGDRCGTLWPNEVGLLIATSANGLDQLLLTPRMELGWVYAGFTRRLKRRARGKR